MRRVAALLAAAALAACSHAPSPPAADGDLRTQASPPLVAGGDAPAVLALPASAHPTVALRLHFVAGSVDDPPGKEGLTALTAAVMAEGGTERLSSAELARALYPMAAELEVVADKETTVFAGRCPRADVGRFAALLADVVLRPRFDPGEFERLRRRALDALRKGLRAEDEEELAKEALSGLLYAGHPYAHPALGVVEGLQRITLDDVRAQWRAVFVRSRLTVGAAGGYPGDLPAQLARELAPLPLGARRGTLPPPAGGGPRFLLVETPGAPAAISLGLRWDVRRGHPDFPALVAAVSALGEHRQGAAFRLFRELRELRDLSHGAYAYPEHFVQSPGSALPAPHHARTFQAFTVWVRPVEQGHRLFAVRAALREVTRWARDGLDEAELSRVKRFLAGHTLALDGSDARRLGQALDDRFYGLAEPWLPTLRRRLAELTLAEVNGALRRHVDPARLQVVVATAGAAALAAEIRAGAPSPITYPTPRPRAVVDADREIATFPLAGEVEVVRADALFER
jgi:zinc protease